MNGLDIEAYLTYIFETLKQIDHPTEADYRKVLPYSQELPEILKVKSNKTGAQLRLKYIVAKLLFLYGFYLTLTL